MIPHAMRFTSPSSSSSFSTRSGCRWPSDSKRQNVLHLEVRYTANRCAEFDILYRVRTILGNILLAPRLSAPLRCVRKMPFRGVFGGEAFGEEESVYGSVGGFDAVGPGEVFAKVVRVA